MERGRDEPTSALPTVGQGASACLPSRISLLRGSPVLAAHWAAIAAARSSGQKRRGLRFESLETRSLLSATVLPSISGIVYEDLTGSGLTSNDTRLANVTVNLFRDGGDGVFEGKSPGSDDTLVGTTTSDANGKYQFNNLSAGTYFVQEVGVPGLVIASGQGVQTVVITSSDLQGTTGTTIDSFASTSQYVSGSLHGGKTGTSSQSTPDAIGGHRNLYVQLTSTGGGVSLGADSDWPGLLDFGANAASNGIFWVNWDGNNSNAAVLNPTGLGQVDHHVARRQHGHRTQRGRRPRRRFHHAQGLQRCRATGLGPAFPSPTPPTVR